MDNHRVLKELQKKLTAEVSDLEEEIRPLQERLARKKEILDATNRLIDLFEGPDQSAPQLESDSPGSFSPPAISNASRDFTPTYLYWPAILQSLVDSGGSARGEHVTDRVGEKLKEALKPADYERVSSGVLRWRNRVAWQRFNMIREGLLKSDSPRGVWEITDKGRKWLSDFLRDLNQKKSA